MCCKKLFLPGLTLVVLTFVGGCVFFAGRAQSRGAKLEQWQTENKIFKVRVISSWDGPMPSQPTAASVGQYGMPQRISQIGNVATIG